MSKADISMPIAAQSRRVLIEAVAATSNEGFANGMLLTVAATAAATVILWVAPETKNARIR
ncbi:hypothetical protein [Variovorax sp. 22077]|uniref:hypothetical protein n=1 Tax=Variovorax sp. 22077 TaxID=3453867 RepID=UPI003F851870